MRTRVVAVVALLAGLLASSAALDVAPAAAASGDISTVVGGGASPLCPAGVFGRLSGPVGIASAPGGDLYIADSANNRVRRIPRDGGHIETVAGTGAAASSGDGGQATAAGLWNPYDVAVDSAGNLFIVEFFGRRVRRVDAATGVITTIVGNGTSSTTGDGGPAASATLEGPTGLALDAADNLYIADNWADRVRRIDKVSGVITTYAGSGTSGFSGDGGAATAAQLNAPTDVAVEANGDLVVADTENHRVRHVAAGTTTITTVAGNGTSGFSGDGGAATAAAVYRPLGIAVNPNTAKIVVSEQWQSRIREFTPGSTIGSLTAAGPGSSGNNGPASSAQLNLPAGLAFDEMGHLGIADRGNHQVRMILADTGYLLVRANADGAAGFTGDCTPPLAHQLAAPVLDVEAAPDGDVYLALDGSVARVDATTNRVTVVAGTDGPGFVGSFAHATATAFDPQAIAVRDDGTIFIAETDDSRVRRVRPWTGQVTNYAGGGGSFGDGGPAHLAALAGPYGIDLDAQGNLFIADTDHHRIRRVDRFSATITTVAGNGTEGDGGDFGPATAAELAYPYDVAISDIGDLVIADTSNDAIRVVDGRTEVIATPHFAGTPFDSPQGVEVDEHGSVFVTSAFGNQVHRWDRDGGGNLEVVAGTGGHGFSGDGGPATAAQLRRPTDVTLDATGNLLIADTDNGRVRRVESPEPALGLLRVTTNPAVPATISVDGVPRDAWGLTWLPLPAGNHLVCFGPVAGYRTPACQNVIVTEGATTTVTGNYVQRGFLRVVTSPALPSTITVDGVARNDWGVWTEVDPGTYQVCFGAVEDFNTPSCRNVNVTAGNTATTTGTFSANPAAPGPGTGHGFARVTTDPAVGSRISIDGQWRDSWGLTWMKLAAGPHTVCFDAVPGFETPDCQVIVLTAGQTTEVTGSFVQHGSVRVITDPALPATIRIDGHRANVWGVWVDLAPGNYWFCFDPVPGFTTPPCISHSVHSGSAVTLTGDYD